MASDVATKPATGPETKKPKKNALSDGQGRLAGMLLSPTMLVIVVTVGFPIVLSIRESLFNRATEVDPTTGLIPQGESFVGLENFTNIFASLNVVTANWGTMDRFWNAFINTTLFTIICVAIETVLGVAMAVIMAKGSRAIGLVRAGILIPWAIPTIASAVMWKVIFTDGALADNLLNQQFLWLADGPQSFWAIVIADVWKTAPFIGLLTLAGLQTIPAEVYEAAKVDGATAWQIFTRITLPMVRPTLVVAVLFRTLDTMRMFDLPWGMIGAGKYSVETLSIFAYIEANAQRYGPAAAYSIVLFFYLMIVAFAFIKLLGADVVNDEEITAMKDQKKRNKKKAKSAAAKPTTTSGDMP